MINVKHTNRHLQIMHMERMGDKPLPSLKEELAHDPELRKRLKNLVSEKAIEAENKAKRIEAAQKREARNKVLSLEEWIEQQEQKGCI